MEATTIPTHDNKDQLRRIEEGLLAGEHVIAVYDGKGRGTGFLGITNRRLILQDNSFAGGRTALTSVPFSRVQSVSLVSDKSLLGSRSSTSTLSVVAGGQAHEIEMRGHEKAQHAHDVILGSLLQPG